MEFSAQQIAEFLGGKVEGNQEAKVHTFSKIEEAQAGSLTFLYNPKYAQFIYETKASIVLVNDDLELTQEVESTLVRVPNAYEALAKLLTLYEQYKPKKTGIEVPSYVSKSAQLGENIYLGAFSHIGENVKIGDNVRIYPNCTIGDGTVIGDNCIVYSNVSIYEATSIGNNCIIHSGAVIGSDGFGFAEQASGERTKIPQIGVVIIEDDVEIGANTAIDRSTMGSTIIKKGVKIDNLVQIGHNVEVGDNTVLCGQVGIAGSSKLGKNIILAGQVGLAGHLTIGDNVRAAAQSGVASSVKENEIVMGSPAYDYKAYRRSFVLGRKLPDMNDRLNQLEKELAALKAKNETK